MLNRYSSIEVLKIIIKENLSLKGKNRYARFIKQLYVHSSAAYIDHINCNFFTLQ